MSDAGLLVLAVAAGCAVAALRWPVIGLLAYLWLDFMRPHDTYVELRSLHLMFVLGGVTLAVTAWRERRHLLDAWRALLPVAAVAAAVAASVVVSVDRMQSVQALFEAGKMLALVWLFERLVRSEQQVHAVLWVLVLSLGTLAVGAIAQAISHDLLREFRPQLAIEGPAGLGDGAFRDNNDLARVLALSVPLWWALAARHGARWSRLFAAAGLLVAVAAVECTFSRGGFLALLVGAAGVALSYRPLWRGAVIWLVFAAVLLGLSPHAYVGRIATLDNLRADASFRGRVDIWDDAWQLVQRHPLLGRGAGTFRVAEPGAPALRRSSHNILVEIAVEIGLLGLAVYGWMLLDTLLRLQRLRCAAPTPGLYIAAVGIEAALLAYLTAAMALSRPFASPLFVLIGLSLALQRCAERTGRTDEM